LERQAYFSTGVVIPLTATELAGLVAGLTTGVLVDLAAVTLVAGDLAGLAVVFAAIDLTGVILLAATSVLGELDTLAMVTCLPCALTGFLSEA
jgi:hypothetical protein